MKLALVLAALLIAPSPAFAQQSPEEQIAQMTVESGKLMQTVGTLQLQLLGMSKALRLLDCEQDNDQDDEELSCELR